MTPDTDDNADSNIKKNLFIIDGFAQLFRAYHAIRTQLSSPVTNEPTNATYGYVGMLLKILQQYQPDYLMVAIDVSGDRGTFRTDIYPDYKANRESPPMDFKPQVTRSLDITRLMGIPVIGVERYEADDVIATLVTNLTKNHPHLHISIISKDKDLEQLLSNQVDMLDVHKDERITVDTLLEKKGITPDQVIDMLTLIGDNVDNIPGVSGIGPKTASQLLQQYGNLENLYNNLNEIKGKKRVNLEAAINTLPLTRDLITLRNNVEFQFELADSVLDPATLPVDEISKIFHELGFDRYTNDLIKITGKTATPVKAVNKSKNQSNESDADKPYGINRPREAGLFDGMDSHNYNQSPTHQNNISGKYKCIYTINELNSLVKQLQNAPIIAVDTETTSVSPMNAKLCGISISTETDTGCYIPIRSPEPDKHLDEQTVIQTLRPILENPNIPKVGHNIKYDLIILRRHGIELTGITADTMVASYLVDSARNSHSMDALALAFLNYRCISITELLGKPAKGKKPITFDQVPLTQAVDYAAEDADITLKLYHYLHQQLQEMDLCKLFNDVEMPLVSVLADIEFAGITVDPDILENQRSALATRILQLRKDIIDTAPHPFNPDSPKQLSVVLFNKPDDDPPGLGLKIIKKGKTGPSTDIEVMEKLILEPSVTSPIPAWIVDYRQLTKLVNTYLVSLNECINNDTKRVHASFNQTVAATGRLSSSDPNLQNIPVRTDVGRQIRKAFIAAKGHMLITADYSQIELRLLAHLSQDSALINAFKKGEDIHRAVAAEIYGLNPDDVTDDQRRNAKMVNFGIVYGISAFGLARRLGEGVTNTQAALIINNYKAKYPGIDNFLAQCVVQAKTWGFVETILKRRRAIPQIFSRNQNEKMLGERMAINSVVQGSAADLIKLAMINLHKNIPHLIPTTKMLLQIHDELVFEVPENDVEKALEIIVLQMESAMTLSIPVKVDAAISHNWYEGK